MKKLRIALAAIFTLAPALANASLIQDVYLVGENGDPDTYFGRLTFPSERQVPSFVDPGSGQAPFVNVLGGPATCDFPIQDTGLDLCQPFSFASDFPELPSEFPNPFLNGVGGWVIGSDGMLSDIIGIVRYGLSDGTLFQLFFRQGAVCGTVETDPIGLAQCFSEEGPTLVRYEPVGVPEPASLALLGFGLVGIGVARRKKK